MSSKTFEELWNSIPLGYLPPNHEFFHNTNELLEPFKKQGVITLAEKNNENQSPTHKEVFCNVPGCKLVFDTVFDYQTHYNSLHRHLCSQCQKQLPTLHLLDLHLSEQHDSFFAARVERGEAMYVCYLEECKEKMLTPKERKEHCITQHKFPANFRFDQITSVRRNHSKSKNSSHPSPGQSKAVESGADSNSEELHATKGAFQIKAFTFGHCKERTFNSKSKRTKQKSKEALENLNELKQALDGMDNE